MPASTGSARATQENLLRTVYLRDFRRQFNLKSILLQSILRDTQNFAPGKNISVPLHAAAGEGGIFSDRLHLPPAQHEQIERATFNYRGYTHRIEILGDFEEDAGMGPPASEVQPLEFQMQALVKNARHDLNFHLFGDGSGSLTTIASAASATTCVVDDIRGLRNNLRVDVVRSADGITGGGVVGAQITVNRATKTVTLTGGKQWTDGTGAELNANATDYKMYRHKSYGQAPFGLDAAVSHTNPPSEAGNYGNVDRTASGKEFYQAQRLHNSGTPRDADLNIFQDAIDEVDINSDGEVNLFVTTHEIWKHLLHQVVVLKRYPGREMRLNGWAQAIEFAGIPIVKDKHCPAGTAYGLDTRQFRIFQNDEGKWMDRDGAILSRVADQVAYEAAWFRRLQLVCFAPNAQVRIEDLKYTAPS